MLRVLERGVEEGLLRPGLNHVLVAHLILGMIDGLRKAPENVYRREEVLDELLEVLIKGIGVEGAEARVTYEQYQHVRGADER